MSVISYLPLAEPSSALTEITTEGQSFVSDERFGSCLKLAGTSVNTTDVGSSPLGSLTVEVWVRMQCPSSDSIIVAAGGGAQLSVTPTGVIVYQTLVSDSPLTVQTGPGCLRFDEWNHVAVTSDPDEINLYLDGAEVASVTPTGPVTPSSNRLFVGADQLSARRLTGRLAHLRIYDEAVDSATIGQDMAIDEPAMTVFARTYPLDFDLSNPDGQHVLYIDDAPAGETMTLELTNSSSKDLELIPQSGAVSASNYHLALRWRGDTLLADCDPQPAPAAWSRFLGPDQTIYLLYADGLTIPASGTVAVTLNGLRADGARGTRGTRVELAYQRMRHVGEIAEVTGKRHQALEIVNHRGRPHLPLDVSLLNGGRVPSTPGSGGSVLRLRLANLSPDRSITFNGPGTGLASSLVVSFEVQPEDEYRPWALTTQTDAATTGLWVEIGNAPNWDIHKDSQHPRWTISPLDQQEVLAPGDALQFALGYFCPLTDPGHAPIVVAYHNLPGFQDGFLSVEVERSPIIFSGNDVYIGSQLNVAGPLNTVNEVNVGSNLNVGGSLSIGGVELTAQHLQALINHVPIVSPI